MSEIKGAEYLKKMDNVLSKIIKTGDFTEEDRVEWVNNYREIILLLSRFSKYEDKLSSTRITENFNIKILEDGDDPELYDDMQTLYNAYLKLGYLEDIYETKEDIEEIFNRKRNK